MENDKKFGLPVFEDGCVVVASKVWLEYVAGLTFIDGTIFILFLF